MGLVGGPFSSSLTAHCVMRMECLGLGGSAWTLKGDGPFVFIDV